MTVTSAAGVGQPGLGFYHPTTRDLSAQFLAGFPAPTILEATQPLTSSGQPQLQFGTLSIQKAGDDTGYYGLAGAEFQVLQGTTVEATLTTDGSGATSFSPELAVGTYTVHELTPPSGYSVAPDQTVTINAATNTVVDFTGPEEDHVVPASISIEKVDAEGGGPLAGATFDLRYSTGNNGAYDQDLGTCTTGPSGTCSPTGNDGPAAFLPGDYQITEVATPSGFYLDPTKAVQNLTLVPGQVGQAVFADFSLGSLQIAKSGDDTAYVSVDGAIFTVAGPAPSTANVGTLTIGTDGQSPVLAGLSPGTYTISETAPPRGTNRFLRSQ